MPDRIAMLAPDGLESAVPLYHPEHMTPARRARNNTSFARTLLTHLPLAVGVIDSTLKLLYWNESAGNLFGVPPLVAASRPLLPDILSRAPQLTSRQIDRILAFAKDQIAVGNRVEAESSLRISLSRERRVVFRVRGLGARRWMLLIDDGRMLSAFDRSGAGRGDAWLDSLTGLGNRRQFNEALNDLVQNTSTDARKAVLMIDLDRFKPVNDGFGHAVGDALLCVVAQRLRRETREDDLLFRLGGDEFVILAPDGTQAEPLAARIIETLSRPFLVDSHTLHISASIGIAWFPDHGQTADDLMRHADLALYEAKSAGKRSWRAFAPEMAAEARSRRELEADLRRALALDEMFLVYQPQMDIHTHRVTGFEALLRWKHPARGVVPPNAFIPFAEELGVIVPLGEWVMRMACQEAARWREPLYVAVNVSPRQLEEPERLIESIQTILRETGLDPSRLELEITESSLLKHENQVLPLLHRLRDRRIRIAMDDFGTGYSSLGRLRSFPFDKIKVDRSFIAALGDARDAAAVVQAIAALGAGLGMVTTAEGVETPEQAALVEAAGYSSIQGYLISKPIPANEIGALLDRYANGAGFMT